MDEVKFVVKRNEDGTLVISRGQPYEKNLDKEAGL